MRTETRTCKALTSLPWLLVSCRPTPPCGKQVDGDTSTNDCVIGLASGASGAPLIKDASSAQGKALEAALTALLQVGSVKHSDS